MTVQHCIDAIGKVFLAVTDKKRCVIAVGQWEEALEQATAYALLQQLQTLKTLPIHSYHS
jgi:hypothetical protein